MPGNNELRTLRSDGDRLRHHGCCACCRHQLLRTANTYSAPDEPSISECIIGDWFDQGGARRERTVLATKLFESTDPWPNNGGLSALSIRRACDASLSRLKTDYIDVLQMGVEGGARAGSPEVLALREQHREQLDATAAIARDLGVTVPRLAIAWLLTRPAVVAPIVGPRTLEQLNSLIPAASLRLDAAVLDDLDRIWPGPGPAPEAYAW